MSETKGKGSRTRNFCIIAHIDHGKSTLADRLLEKTATLAPRKMRNQVLDDMDLERERGITIKSHPIRLDYTVPGGETYLLNLIDTPGHVDFTYEVSRSLAACEGALLLVDAVQGIEAQTMSNLFLALDNDLVVIPIINKIDLPNNRKEELRGEMCDLLDCNPDDILLASAKEGRGIDKILRAIVEKIPPPAGDRNAPLKALIFDSNFDNYRGAIPYIRVVDGNLCPGMDILLHSTRAMYEVTEVGIFKMDKISVEELSAGDVGYLVASIRKLSDIRVGDTVMNQNQTAEPLPGYRDIKPMVYCSLYPADSEGYMPLKTALEKLNLNDASLKYEPESSGALGFGFRCGFLGMLHMEIIQERLYREFGLDLVTTVPNVRYRVRKKDGSEIDIESTGQMPERQKIDAILEPFVRTHVITPREYMGNVMKLCQERRGNFGGMTYPDLNRVVLNYNIPLSEIIFDFHDRLKSLSQGYASLDYEFTGYRESNLVKIDILINGKVLDALSVIIHRSRASNWGRKLTGKLKGEIPRQMFEVVIQAALEGRVVSRETIRPLRKNVTAKLYGGDITRKRKLLEKQKEGKKRMKRVGSVDIPQEAFMAVLSIRE
jgi:GTP-binding protein LepA